MNRDIFTIGRGKLRRESSQVSGKGDTFAPGAISGSRLVSATNALILVLNMVCLTSCGFLSIHHFTAPAKDWQSRNGQLMYRTGRMSVVGEVLVRFSKAGDFELTFSKGPGVTLFIIQQDATFAHVKSSLTHLSWSGPVDRAPTQLRGWLSLRERLMAAPDERVVRQTTGDEVFVFRF